MIRALVALVFAIAATACIDLPARANTCTLPNTLSNGQVVDANVLNTNFVSLQSCGNNIDSTNIGPAGILASQIIASSSANGTFGGSVAYTFPAALNVKTSGYFGTGNVSATGIGLNSAPNATYPVLNNDGAGSLNLVSASIGSGFHFYTNNGSASTQTAQLDLTGDWFTNRAMYADGATGGNTVGFHAGFGASSGLFQSHANAQTPAVIDALTHTASDGYVAFTVTRNQVATNLLSVLDNGQTNIAGPISSGASGAFVPPVYGPTGGISASTEHIVRSIYTTTISASCAVGATCSLNTNTINFSGAAVFTSASTYDCQAANYLTPGTSGLIVTLLRSTGSALLFNVVNGTSAAVASGSYVSVDYHCDGS